MTPTDMLGLSLLGFVGSLHCLGMCGAFLLCLGSGRRLWLYQSGRALMYACVGAVLSLAGLSVRLQWEAAGGRISLLVAGAIMVWMGLDLMGVVPRFSRSGRLGLPGRYLAKVVGSSGLLAPLLLGFLTGLLPCGLLYAALVRAAACPGPTWGALAMVFFWFGTLPLLTGYAHLRGKLPARWATLWPYLAGGVTVVIGIATALSALSRHGACGL